MNRYTTLKDAINALEQSETRIKLTCDSLTEYELLELNAALNNAPDILEIDLSGIQVGVRIFSVFQGLYFDKLQKINLSNVGIGNRKIYPSLNASNVSEHYQAFTQFLIDNPNLKSLDLSNNDFPMTVLKNIVINGLHKSKLNHFNVSNAIVCPDLSNKSAQLNGISSRHHRKCRITSRHDRTLRFLLRNLVKIPNLQTLDLSDNHFANHIHPSISALQSGHLPSSQDFQLNINMSNSYTPLMSQSEKWNSQKKKRKWWKRILRPINQNRRME